MFIETLLLGTLTLTAYRATPAQTKPECLDNAHCQTAIGENVSELGTAISQDLLANGKVHYRDVLYIEGVGFRIVNDTMNKRIHNAVDIFVYTKKEERAIGVLHVKVWVLRQTGGLAE